MTNRVQVKITIAKLLELAYSTNKGVTTKIMLSKGNFKLREMPMEKPYFQVA